MISIPAVTLTVADNSAERKYGGKTAQCSGGVYKHIGHAAGSAGNKILDRFVTYGARDRYTKGDEKASAAQRGQGGGRISSGKHCGGGGCKYSEHTELAEMRRFAKQVFAYRFKPKL